MNETKKKLLALIEQHKWREVEMLARSLAAVADYAQDNKQERRSAPVCRICGEEGHTWQRCGND